MTHLVELCAGTASVSLWAMARLPPLTGYMGSKRRDAPMLCSLLGARDPDHVTLVDAGPWGDVWAVLRDQACRREVAGVLRQLDARGRLSDVWPMLATQPPDADSAPARVAQYLCLQSRSSGCIPIWWHAAKSRWESPSGSRTEVAHQRGRKQGARKDGPLYRSHPARGIQRIATLAERVEALDRIDWSRVTVRHCDVGDVQPGRGSVVYFDPPYAGAPRYACLLPRARVLAIATAHAEVARLVVVSEASPLPLDGWSVRRLRDSGKPEWLTIWGETSPCAEQMTMLDEAAP